MPILQSGFPKVSGGLEYFLCLALSGAARIRKSLLKCAVLFLASTTPALGQSADPAPPKFFLMTPTGVNLFDTSFTQESTDLVIGPLSLTRSYISSRIRSSEYFGNKWTHNFDIWAEEQSLPGQNYVVIVIGRATYRYYGTAASNVPETDEAGTSVASVSGSIVFTDRDGVVYRFTPTVTNSPQRISSITYPDGSITTVSYSSWRPKTIVSNRGYAIVLDYSGTSERVSAACTFNLSQIYISISTTCSSATAKTAYTYSPVSSMYDLVSVTDVSGKLSQYAYDSAYNALSCIKPPGYAACKVALVYGANIFGGSEFVLKSQTFADGSIWQFECSCGMNAKNDPDEAYPIEGTTVTKPDGSTTQTLFQSGTLYRVTNENGQIYSFEYHVKTPLWMKTPEGVQTFWLYNGNGVDSGIILKAKSGSGQADITIGAKTFPASCNPVTCNKPLTVADARSNATNYTYDATHGGVISEMRPSATSGAARPLTLHTYVQKYAYIKNSGGSLVASAMPVWLSSTITQCQTTAGSSTAACDTGAPITVTTFEYGADGTADNLLVRGEVEATNTPSGAPTLRTCYGYDAQNNKIWETTPRAGLTSCS